MDIIDIILLSLWRTTGPGVPRASACGPSFMSKDGRLVHSLDRAADHHAALNLAATGETNEQRYGTGYTHVWRLVTRNRVSSVV